MPAQPQGPVGFYHSSFPLAPVCASNAPPRMKNERINEICQGSSCQTKGIGKKKEGKSVLTFSIARVLAGGERSQDVSFSFLVKEGVKVQTETWYWCQLPRGQGLPATAWVGFTSALPCQCPWCFLPAETEPDHLRWSHIKLLGDFCGLHSVKQSPRSHTWEPEGSMDLAALITSPGEWEGHGTQREEGQILSKANPPCSTFPKAVCVGWPPVLTTYHRTTYECLKASLLLSKAASSHSIKARIHFHSFSPSNLTSWTVF